VASVGESLSELEFADGYDRDENKPFVADTQDLYPRLCSRFAGVSIAELEDSEERACQRRRSGTIGWKSVAWPAEIRCLRMKELCSARRPVATQARTSASLILVR